MSGRVYIRKFDWDEARRLRADGLTIQEIADRLGVSRQSIRNAVVPGEYARQMAYRAEYQRNGGTCLDCGAPVSYNASRGPTRRCRGCTDAAKVTAVTDTHIRCVVCREWKPDNDFPYSRAARKPHRGRSRTCRTCQTITRQQRRERRKLPCVGCGKPALPAEEKRTHGAPEPRCRECLWEWQRLPEQREASRIRTKEAAARKASGERAPRSTAAPAMTPTSRTATTHTSGDLATLCSRG